MARPKSKITDKNIYAIESYLKKAFEEFRLFDAKDAQEIPNAYFKAKRAFETLPKVDYSSKAAQKNSRDELLSAFQKWIDTYLTTEDRTRCFVALRQHKFHQKKKLKTIKLPWESYYDITSYAKKVNMTIGDAITKAVRKELDRLNK